MTSLAAVVAILAVIALSALALSVFAFFQSQASQRASGSGDAPAAPVHDPALDQMRTSLEGLAAQIREMQSAPPSGAAGYRPGLNLSKRSQALRMHRTGEPASQIAAALDLPHQEVELLIKVHRIVLSKL